MMKFRFKEYQNWFFSYQKLPFKWLEITIGRYSHSSTKSYTCLDHIEIIVQITKIRLFFVYDRASVDAKKIAPNYLLRTYD